MPPFRSFRIARCWWPLAAGALALAGCQDRYEAVPATGRDYYPVAVGRYWIYAVQDTVWTTASVQGSSVTPSVAQASAFQLRETVTETFADAAGNLAYRLVRAHRTTAADAWVNDSVFVLSATEQAVVLNRNNARTVELIFPVRAGRSWNFNAFNNNSNDTITAETRQYSRVGEPFTTGGGSTGQPATTYATTVTVSNTGTAAENSLLKRVSYQQVYAKGVGPVLRRRVNLAFFNYVNPANGNQVYVPTSFFSAATRREVLIESK